MFARFHVTALLKCAIAMASPPAGCCGDRGVHAVLPEVILLRQIEARGSVEVLAWPQENKCLPAGLDRLRS